MVKLDKNIIEDIFALTPMQEGMLFHYLKEPQNRYYLEQLSLVITGDIDLKCFENAWNVVIETNEMLRTMFRWEKLEHPVQVILKKHQLQWKYFDFSTIIDEANKNENEIERNWKKCLEKIKAKDRDQSFELQQVPFRITLCKIGENRYEMIISNHHILYDGWSNGIILKEFFKAYDDLSKGKEFVKPVKTKFKEFIKWNRNQGVNIDKQEKFWRNYLKGIESRTELSIKRSKGKGKTTVGIENLHVNFKKELKDKIENFVRNYRITLASFLYGVWGLLLQKYNNSYHAVFGTTVSGRSVRIDGIEDMVGLFINTIPLRIRTNPAEKIGDLLHRIDNHLQVREEYEQTSFVDIRKSSEIGSREELFDSIVILENYPLERRLTREHNQLSVGSYSMFERTHYDLTVTVTIFAGIDANIAYNETLFAEDSIARLADHFQCIAREIVEGPEKQVSHLEGITEEEKKQVLYEFNDTAADYPVDKTLHRLLEEHVARTPDRVALLGQTHLTYRELNEKAGHLAHLLQQQGVIPDTIVGIMMERSIEMVIGIMGILKAGGAYLPIEPGYPRERIDYMLGDSKARILVSEVSKVSEVSEGTAVIDLPSLIIENKDTEPTHLTHLTHPTHLCYVLYTSGSTGKPKGVLLEHGAVVNILTALQREYPLRESDGFLFKTPYVFDISVTELFGWFWEGGRLVVLEKDGEKDPGKILDIIEKIGITHINFVPSMFNIFVEALDPQNKGKLSGLKYILLCGEELLPGVIGRLRALNTKITAENIYGPTEAAIYASKYSLDQWENSGFIPIGKPLPNYKIYILDKDGHLQPIGVPGELCIYGDGLARGYLHNLELTAEKFLVSYRSYRTNRTYIPSKKIYKTGDLARWLPDGNIEFLGRMDLQVKIRGFRVELGEIENRLLDHPAVKEAAVIARDDRKGEKYLCAYLVHDEKGVDTRQLKEFLSTRLPDYMIPGYFIPLPGLPLTSSNKINRNALPEPVLKASQGCGPPRNQIEKKLVETWMEVLGRDRDGGGGQQPMIGIDDNFFELGGHSLKAMALMLKIHKEFNVKVSLPEIFDALTIRWLSHHIENKTGEKYVSIEPAPQKDYYALSPAQMRLYLIQQLNQKSTGYNMSWAAALEGDPDYNRLEGVFIRLIDRHESLRTSFHMLAGQPVQRVHENVEFEIEYYSDTGDTGDGEERKQEANRQLPTDFFRPFDLSRAPLLRVGLIKKTGLYHFIIIDMHHIISDGTSMSILTREFVNLYKGAGLPILKLRYKDFSEWQNRRLGSGKLKRQEEYWLSHLSGELPILNMPFDYPRPTVQGFDGDRVHYQLEGQLTRDLNALAGETGTTLYMVLLAAYNLLVRGYTGQEDIIIGTPIAGRTHADLENVIGLFLETLAIRSYPRGERYFNHFLEEIKNTTLTAYENQDYPFRELIKKKADINN
ncbi:MAG: amino acid adenylation domain-containing protein, partial [Candidatus Aminicenantes bacterium]|nr:amino acid adenylation domain-containing protein [Candidatus Aminicenantes bacterium]NIM84869.1 amino acid adenylation domain-containing protein [Candidatus Aminicenantes bacterium]NIN24377.1 amino acid adenylation domain-containing protein [Candidatus Aminicenantes bacterium]NIN48141.1 amino acid adenylation domain-containing protein [Candidatus Aminicenantes bacterium]NIN91044.1 amino acid adenylation domain-containing protein [Candidatus Aminicenantes bacterium]